MASVCSVYVRDNQRSELSGYKTASGVLPDREVRRPLRAGRGVQFLLLPDNVCGRRVRVLGSFQPAMPTHLSRFSRMLSRLRARPSRQS